LDLPNYNTVAERIAEFAAAFPGGSLRQKSIQFVKVGDADFVVYTAEAWRTPDDQAPGQGTAWERIPGLTNFTKNSEVQNAETSAWGRAIVAVLAADTRKSDIASSNEMQSRVAERDPKALTDAITACEKAKSKVELRPLYTTAVALGMSKEKALAIQKNAETLPEDGNPADLI